MLLVKIYVLNFWKMKDEFLFYVQKGKRFEYKAKEPNNQQLK